MFHKTIYVIVWEGKRIFVAWTLIISSLQAELFSRWWKLRCGSNLSRFRIARPVANFRSVFFLDGRLETAGLRIHENYWGEGFTQWVFIIGGMVLHTPQNWVKNRFRQLLSCWRCNLASFALDFMGKKAYISDSPISVGLDLTVFWQVWCEGFGFENNHVFFHLLGGYSA